MKHLAPLLLPLALAGRGGFDHGLEMEPLAVPEAHHGEKMRLSRFLVAVPGIEETATRLLNKCVSGQDVASDLPLELAVVELRIDAVYFAGVRVGDARAGVPSPDAEEALGQALQQAADSSRWLSKRGCKPWTGERPWLLLAADERVAMQGVNGLMEQAHAAGFRDIAVLVDDGSPAPELPPEEPPKNARELMLVERPESWTALAGEDERRSGSLEDVQVWLRTGELSADRVTVVMDPASELSELIRVQDALVGAGVLCVLPG